MVNMFIWYFENNLILMILLGFLAFLYVDSWYYVIFLISWPLLVKIMMFINSCINGVNWLLNINMLYYFLVIMLIPLLMLAMVLVILLVSWGVLGILGNYVSYWMLGCSLLVLSLIVYIVSEVNLVWIGVLPVIFFYMNQNLVMLLFIVNVIWYY